MANVCFGSCYRNGNFTSLARLHSSRTGLDCTRMAADQHFRKMRFKPDVRLELGSNEAVKESVAGGLGIGVVSRHALHGLKKEHGVSVIELDGFPLPSAWHIVHPASKKLSPLALAFKQHLRKQQLG